MDKKLEERIKGDARLRVDLERELAAAISGILEEYGVTGKYIFNVRKDAGYCHKQVEELKDRKLLIPLWCLASGSTTVEKPYKILPI